MTTSVKIETVIESGAENFRSAARRKSLCERGTANEGTAGRARNLKPNHSRLSCTVRFLKIEWCADTEKRIVGKAFPLVAAAVADAPPFCGEIPPQRPLLEREDGPASP